MTIFESPDDNYRFGPDAIDRHILARRRLGLARPGERLARVLAELNRIQIGSHVHGAVANIGIPGSRTIGLLFLATRNTERALAIEIDEGDRILEPPKQRRAALGQIQGLLRQSATDHADIDMIRRAARDVEPDGILDSVGPVRLLSINDFLPEHHVRHCLSVAELVLSGGGIVVVQGVFDCKRPGAAGGVAQYLMNPQSRLEPFLITAGDVWLTSPEFGAYYRPRLQKAHWAGFEGGTTFLDWPVDVYGPRDRAARVWRARFESLRAQVTAEKAARGLQAAWGALPSRSALVNGLFKGRVLDHAATLLHRLGGSPIARHTSSRENDSPDGTALNEKGSAPSPGAQGMHRSLSVPAQLPMSRERCKKHGAVCLPWP